jgi:hypothetical protein
MKWHGVGIRVRSDIREMVGGAGALGRTGTVDADDVQEPAHVINAYDIDCEASPMGSLANGAQARTKIQAKQ